MVTTIMSLLTTMNRLTTKNRWSNAVDDMLRQVVDDGFAFYVCGERFDSVVLVAAYHWEGYVDLLTITEPDRVTVAWAVREPGFDVFNPSKVVWTYGNKAEPTLRALPNLKHPDLTTRVAAPHGCVRAPAATHDLQSTRVVEGSQPRGGWRVHPKATSSAWKRPAC